MKPRRNEEAQAHIGLSSHTKKIRLDGPTVFTEWCCYLEELQDGHLMLAQSYLPELPSSTSDHNDLLIYKTTHEEALAFKGNVAQLEQFPVFPQSTLTVWYI
jgi:hypothetical protein